MLPAMAYSFNLFLAPSQKQLPRGIFHSLLTISLPCHSWAARLFYKQSTVVRQMGSGCLAGPLQPPPPTKARKLTQGIGFAGSQYRTVSRPIGLLPLAQQGTFYSQNQTPATRGNCMDRNPSPAAVTQILAAQLGRMVIWC